MAIKIENTGDKPFYVGTSTWFKARDGENYQADDSNQLIRPGQSVHFNEKVWEGDREKTDIIIFRGDDSFEEKINEEILKK